MTEARISWFYNLDGNQKGPFTPDQIDALIKADVINAHTKMWSEAVAEWTPLFRTELRGLLGDKTIQPPPTTSERSLPEPDSTPPQGIVSPQPQPASMAGPDTIPQARRLYGRIRDNRVLARILYWVCILNAVISAITAGIIIKTKTLQRQYELVKALESDDVLMIIAIPLIAAMFLFLWWKYRTASNVANVYGPQSVTPAGAVYWYFVPVFFLWKPYEAMKNICVAYEVEKGKDQGLRLWWLLWLLSLGTGVAVMAFTPEVIETTGQINFYVYGNAVVCAIDALSFYVAALLVWEIMTAEERKLF